MSQKVLKIDPSLLIGQEQKPTKSLCEERDAIIYALGIGFSEDPLKDDELKYTYESHQDFKVFPTMSTCLHKSDSFGFLISSPSVPQFNPMMLLHGEQHTRMFRPLVAGRNYRSQGKIIDVADKGKGCLIPFEVQTYEIDDNGKENLATININSTFIRGLGGFGFKGKNDQFEQIAQKLKRNPDRVASFKTTPNQAIIYRLSGDLNPLHIDQKLSSQGGFEKPILHGLCSYGISAKLVIQTFCKGDSDRLKSIAARFTSHVFPGETLVVSMWKEGSRIHFAAKTQERGLDVVVGQIDIDEKPKL